MKAFISYCIISSLDFALTYFGIIKKLIQENNGIFLFASNYFQADIITVIVIFKPVSILTACLFIFHTDRILDTGKAGIITGIVAVRKNRERIVWAGCFTHLAFGIYPALRIFYYCL
jgi:hypothetical protein